MSAERFIGFVDCTSHHTCNLTLDVWVIYSPSGKLVASGGACLGPATNNVAEYRVFIELLWDVLSRGITQLEVILDSQLVVFQLNGSYQVQNPTLLHHFFRLDYLKEILITFHLIIFHEIKIH